MTVVVGGCRVLTPCMAVVVLTIRPSHPYEAGTQGGEDGGGGRVVVVLGGGGGGGGGVVFAFVEVVILTVFVVVAVLMVVTEAFERPMRLPHI